MENKNLEFKITSINYELDLSKSDNIQSSNTIETLRQKIEGLEKKIYKIENEKVSLPEQPSQENYQLMSKLNSAQLEIKNQQNQIDFLTEQIDQQKKKFENKNNALNEKLEQKRISYKDLDSQNAFLSNKVTYQIDEYQKLNVLFLEKSKKLDQAEIDARDYQRKYQIEVEIFRVLQQQFEYLKRKYEQELVVKNQILVDLKDRDNKSDAQKLKITSLENDVRNFTQQADRMKNTNDQLNNQIIQLNEKVKLLNMNISELERKVTFILFLSLIQFFQISEGKIMLQEWTNERNRMVEENQRLKVLASDRLQEIEKWTHQNFKIMMRMSLAYLELDRITSNKNK